MFKTHTHRTGSRSCPTPDEPRPTPERKPLQRKTALPQTSAPPPTLQTQNRSGAKPDIPASSLTLAWKKGLCYDGFMRRGQTLVEYVLVFVCLLAATVAAGFIVKALRKQHHRTTVVLGSHYP